MQLLPREFQNHFMEGLMIDVDVFTHFRNRRQTDIDALYYHHRFGIMPSLVHRHAKPFRFYFFLYSRQCMLKYVLRFALCDEVLRGIDQRAVAMTAPAAHDSLGL